MTDATITLPMYKCILPFLSLHRDAPLRGTFRDTPVVKERFLSAQFYRRSKESNPGGCVRSANTTSAPFDQLYRRYEELKVSLKIGKSLASCVTEISLKTVTYSEIQKIQVCIRCQERLFLLEW